MIVNGYYVKKIETFGDRHLRIIYFFILLKLS